MLKALLLTLLLASAFNSSIAQAQADTAFHKLNKLFTTGDFDGDKKPDTLYQHNYSRLQKAEIMYAPDPEKTDWDSVVKWFYRQQADVFLKMSGGSIPVLHLGTAQGLYCLINIGDINHDGKDEVALVADFCDYSNVNSCKIYSLCHNRWTLLKEFGIHEAAFSFTGNRMPLFKDIKGFLEKQGGKWKYADYNQNDFNTAEEVGSMKILALKRCL